MPANRSRTERWRECLRQITERGGGIELTPARLETDGCLSDLLMRVRVFDLTDEYVLVEVPNAAGGRLDLEPGQPLIGVMSIGQNRWMFHTTVIGTTHRGNERCLKLEPPVGVERCQRRGFYRISTASLSLPEVNCWPLLDPRATSMAEAASRALIQERRASGATGPVDADVRESVLPEVGPPFRASLVNVSGGGLGLVVTPQDRGAVDELKHYWLAVDLGDPVGLPVCMATKVVHTHIDSGMNLYCGMAFEFSGRGEHRAFVVGEIGRYMTAVLGTPGAMRAA
ncbi:MAG: flagellar brake protein [Planctomycetota bacterium]